MSEQQPEQPPEGGDDKQQPKNALEDAKTFDAEYVDKLRKEAAKYRTEAKANSDAAKRLAEIEEAQKTEAEKSADRIKQLESEVSTARIEALRFKVATQYGIDDEDADLFLTGSDEESLTAQAKRLSARTDERRKQGNRVPDEGRTTTSQPGDAERRAFVRQLTGRD